MSQTLSPPRYPLSPAHRCGQLHLVVERRKEGEGERRIGDDRVKPLRITLCYSFSFSFFFLLLLLLLLVPPPPPFTTPHLR